MLVVDIDDVNIVDVSSVINKKWEKNVLNKYFSVYKRFKTIIRKNHYRTHDNMIVAICEIFSVNVFLCVSLKFIHTFINLRKICLSFFLLAFALMKYHIHSNKMSQTL